MAVIYYRFRSQKPDHIVTIKFDGTGLTVFELKRDIIMANNLLNSADVDIILYSSENIQDSNVFSSENDRELVDDNEVIPRSATVIVRRTNALKKGRGNVQRYVTGKPRLHLTSNSASINTNNYAIPAVGGTTGNGDEDDMIQKMFNAQDQQWSEQQSVLATATRVDTYRPPTNEPVPDYYICYKCGEKGKHNIKNCPKNNDPNWEGVRIRKTTGIPKSYLKTIEKPNENMGDVPPNGTTYMVNDEGKYVVAVADTKAWEQFQNIKKGEKLANTDDIDVEDGELKDPETGKLWKNPVRTPCCNKVYSRKYIEDKLIEDDFTCPNCKKEQIYLDTLTPDEELQKKITGYIEEKSKAKKEEGNSPKRQQLKPPGMTMPMMPMPNMMNMPALNMGMPPFMPFMNPYMNSNTPNPVANSMHSQQNSPGQQPK
ncbi:Protein MPE1 [Pichia kudriavzevii]|uniref:Protein MPE1 n=1 Tax=Pichia kudriavzevii TaxID=4909 RepID=A0A1V2LPD5_PICKU|nr:Protein MPE1 [Pichia kudriavzevii]